MLETKGKLAGQYEALTADRNPYVTRAQQCAQLTLPSLFPKDGSSGSNTFGDPYQSVGADGVNTLASNLMSTLFPVNEPLFRVLVDQYMLEQEEPLTEEAKADLEKELSTYELAVVKDLEKSGSRARLPTAFKQLIVAGNVLILLTEDPYRVIRLDSYVVLRSPRGKVLEVIVKETVARATLPDDVLAQIKESEALQQESEDKPKSTVDKLDVYTKFQLVGNMYYRTQEINGISIAGTEGSWPETRPPFVALRWVHEDAQHYGRSFVEEYIGDLNSLEGLSKDLLESAHISAKTIFGVDPSSPLQPRVLAAKENGAFVQVKEGDIFPIRVDKAADLQTAAEQASVLTRRLEMAFMLPQGVQRDAERVTAQEVRYMALMLERKFGGVYTIFKDELQLPLVRSRIHKMEREKRLPALPEGILEPTIVTGVDALGRGQDLTKLETFIGLVQELGPEVFMKYVDVSNYLTRLATALGLDTDGLVRSSEEIQQMEQAAAQAAQQQAMMEMAKPAVPQIAQAALGNNE